ncbi:MAG: hypothetical protein ABI672_00845 [Vicinamibacteria bacterium]
MRVGFLGNANNYPFMLARAFRRAGHDVLFVVDRTTLLDRPENRYSDVGPPYPTWIHDASNLPAAWSFHKPGPELRSVIESLRSCDAVVLNQAGLALAPWIERPHIGFLTGADLTVLANTAYGKDAEGYRGTERAALELLIASQREGIRSSVALSYFYPGVIPIGDALLAEIGIDEDRRLFSPMSDTDYIPFSPPPNNEILRVFCPARLCWIRKPGEPVTEDYKGTDILLRGLARFVATTGRRLDIRLPRKGKDLEAAKTLVTELGLDPLVQWFEPMSQAAVLLEYAEADIVFDQLGKSIIGMSGMDALAVGRPVIANGRPEVVERFLGQPFAVLQASTPDEITEQLLALSTLDAREAAGKAARAFVVEHCSSDRAAKVCASRFGELLANEAALRIWREDFMAGKEALLNEHAERLSSLAETLSQRELVVHEREAGYAARMQAALEREGSSTRVEAALTARTETLTLREQAFAGREQTLAAQEYALTNRERTLADEVSYYRSLPFFKQALQFKAWWRQRKAE